MCDDGDTKHKDIYCVSNFPGEQFVKSLRKNDVVSLVPKALNALFMF